jgi:hypothetical protein
MLDSDPVAAEAGFVFDDAVVVLVVVLAEAATTLTVVLPLIEPSVDVTVSVSDSTVLSVTWNVATPLVNVMLVGTVTLVSDDATVAVPV